MLSVANNLLIIGGVFTKIRWVRNKRINV